jgi:hypothetical protein
MTVRLLAVLIVVATALFVAGVAAERARGDEAVVVEAETHEEAGHDESAESVGGVDTESWPLVALAAAGSLVLAAAVWRRPRWRAVLVVTAVAMAAFAVLDVRELVHQIDESAAGIALIAGVVAALHGAAAVVAVMMYDRVGRADQPAARDRGLGAV